MQGNFEIVEIKKPKKGPLSAAKRILKWAGIFLGGLVLALALAFFTMLYGPFHGIRDLYVITMMETSAAKFMATAFFSEEKLAEIMDSNRLEVPDENTDPSLIGTTGSAQTTTAPPPKDKTTTAQQPLGTVSASPAETTVTEPKVSTPATTVTPPNLGNAEGKLFADHPDAMPQTDGLEGLQLVGVSGTTFEGYMLIITDPSRVFLGVTRAFPTYGEQLRAMVKRYGATAGINGGAFEDEDGKGKGGMPIGVLCSEGKLMFWGPEEEANRERQAAIEELERKIDKGDIEEGSPEAQPPELRDTSEEKIAVIGINNDNVLILGRFNKEEFIEQGFRDAVSFFYPNPPFLVINGQASKVVGTGGSGIQPRTCIGQRQDGAFLFLVVDGRQTHSLGATQKEVMDLMLEFGAFNAANLDGGSSSELYLNGETVSKPCSIYGPRYLPDGFLVR